MSKMNDTRFERLKKRLKKDNISHDQCQELIETLHNRMDKISPPKKQQIVISGYSDNEMQDAIEFAITPYKRQLTKLTDHANAKIIVVYRYMMAVSELAGLTGFFSSLLTPPFYMDKLTDAFAGKSKEIAERTQAFVNAVNAWNDLDGQSDEEDSHFLEDWAIFAATLGRFENAISDQKREKILKQLQDDFKPLGGGVYNRLRDIASSVNFGGAKFDEVKLFIGELTYNYKWPGRNRGDKVGAPLYRDLIRQIDHEKNVDKKKLMQSAKDTLSQFFFKDSSTVKPNRRAEFGKYLTEARKNVPYRQELVNVDKRLI